MIHQRDHIRNIFKQRPFAWIPLPEIQRFAAQYNSRIYDLRREGMNIVNKKERINGSTHSWFKYVPGEQGELF